MKQTHTYIPHHIAIIMDGNGRWAQRRFLPRSAGHRAGVDAVRRIIEACCDLGVGALTLYTFSAENWKRSPKEIGHLMGLLNTYLESERALFKRQGIRFRVAGRTHLLPEENQRKIAEVVAETKDNTGMVLNLALSYSGRWDIIDAVKAIAEKTASGNVRPDEIDEDLFAQHLTTAGLPDPELLIRTSGEMRISNFLLWQCAYTEYYITDVLWPDFNRNHLEDAIKTYSTRERRFGRETKN